MEFQIALSPLAQKDLARVELKNKERLITALLSVREEPEIGRRLKGELDRLFSYEVWPYRIIYELIKEDHLVLVIRIKGRSL